MYREGLCTLHAVSPVGTPCVTVAHYQIQEIKIDTSPGSHSDFTRCVCTYLCMCVYVCVPFCANS